MLLAPGMASTCSSLQYWRLNWNCSGQDISSSGAYEQAVPKTNTENVLGRVRGTCKSSSSLTAGSINLHIFIILVCHSI